MTSTTVAILGDTLEAVLVALFLRRDGIDVTLLPEPRALPLAPLTFELCRPSARELESGYPYVDAFLTQAGARDGHPYRMLFPDGRGGIDAARLIADLRVAGAALVDLFGQLGLPLEGDAAELRIGITEQGTRVPVGIAPAGLAAFAAGDLPRRVRLRAHDLSSDLVADCLAAELPDMAVEAPTDGPLPAGTIELAPPRLAPAAARVRELLPVGAPNAYSEARAGTLRTALAAAGVTVLEARRFSIDVDAVGGMVIESTLDGASRRLVVQGAVLATGKFAAGGIATSPTVRCVGLERAPVLLGGRPLTRVDGERHLSRDALGPHPLFTAGIAVDSALRPLDGEGCPCAATLHAAGAVIGGVDARAGGSGFGLLTAWQAARRVAEDVGRTAAVPS